MPDDIRAHVWRCCCRERDDRRRTEPLAHLGNAQVARPEIVTPFADAVRLVDGEQRNAESLQSFRRAPHVEALRRDVEQLELAALDARQPVGNLCRRERAVHECCRQPAACERIDLILHERDEGRDYYR